MAALPPCAVIEVAVVPPPPVPAALPPRAAAGFEPAMAPPPPNVTLSSADWDELLPDELLQDPGGELDFLTASLDLAGPPLLPRPHSH